ncbi:hypothetical protein DM02DRAFT_589130 [Periconia macrospinosa]|uniref:MARVEL domain-containing protein n=1 Tax=Periconia macrospinosa TaxID=97972 RepID=A0A2V1DZZ7_9PLEO|nr:hypothetical protein DM02DRAFT_589130 [Periconia macrospinosa]
MAQLSFKPTSDKRWQGIQRHYFTLYMIKNLLILPFVGVVIAESVSMKKWGEEDRVSNNGANVKFWERIGAALIPDVALTFVIAFGIVKQRWHPIAALVTSIVYMALWLFVTLLNALVAYSGEVVYFSEVKTLNKWQSMCYAEAGFQGAITLLYMIMLGFASKGLHEWRKARNHRASTVEPSKA